MDARRLIEIVQAHQGSDPYTLAKAIEQEERAYVVNLCDELGFPGIIPLIQNN